MSALDNIKHIIIVMMENRSFDHMLGYRRLPPLNRKDVNGLSTDREWITKHTNHDGDQSHAPFHSDNPYQLPEGFDPPHQREEITQQMGPPQNGVFPMNGFVSSLPDNIPSNPKDRRLVMAYFGPKEVPITHFFAENFAICDNWFCSLPAGTQANRLMAMSGESRIDTNRVPLPKQDLVYDWLNTHNVSWRVYHEGVPFFALIPRWIPNIIAQKNFRNFRHLATDLSNTPPSELPQVIFVEPTYGDCPHKGANTDDHAPAGVSDGQDFLLQIYNAVKTSDKFWKNALLIITYDEHGGFFDHVSPPLIPTNPPANASYDRFESLGVRVPAHIISPYVRKSSVISNLFDHTSILKLLGEKFGNAGSYSPEVDSRSVKSLASALEDKVFITKAPASPPVDQYLANRPPKPTGVTLPAENTALQQAFRESIKEMAKQGVTANHPEFGDLVQAVKNPNLKK